MKVLHIVSDGQASFFRDQIRSLEVQGIDCTVTNAISKHTSKTNNPDFLSQLDNYLFGHNLIYYAVKGGLFYPRVLRRSLFNEFDLVHVHSGIVAPFGMLQPHRPLIISFWGSDIMGNRLRGSVQWVNRRLANYASAVIVMSDEMANYLNVDADVIPHGIDLDKFEPMNRETAVAEVNWDLDAKHVLFLWDPSYEVKRYPMAKRVVDAVDERLKMDIRLQVVYDVTHSSVPVYLNAADAMLLTSKREGSPNTVKESMACNLPVVAMDVGDVADQLHGIENSFVAPNETTLVDRLETVLASNARSNGRTHADEFSKRRTAEQIISVYERVLEDWKDW